MNSYCDYYLLENASLSEAKDELPRFIHMPSFSFQTNNFTQICMSIGWIEFLMFVADKTTN